jgi:hypothetical protein
MFRPMWPLSGVKIYLMGKLLLSVVAAITCVTVMTRRSIYTFMINTWLSSVP